MYDTENYEQPIEKKKVKVFTIINYIIAALSIAAFIFFVIGAIDAYIPEPENTIDISGPGAVVLIFILYGASGFIAPFIVGAITSLINLKFDKKHAIITLLINLVPFLILIAIFMAMVIIGNAAN